MRWRKSVWKQSDWQNCNRGAVIGGEKRARHRVQQLVAGRPYPLPKIHPRLASLFVPVSNDLIADHSAPGWWPIVIGNLLERGEISSLHYVGWPRKFGAIFCNRNWGYTCFINFIRWNTVVIQRFTSNLDCGFLCVYGRRYTGSNIKKTEMFNWNITHVKLFFLRGGNLS